MWQFDNNKQISVCWIQRERCFKLMSLLRGDDSIVNFVISPTTYFLDHVMASVGDRVTGFYDVK